MILVDTSIWIDHLRKGTPKLMALLENGEVLAHVFVLGELACGNIKNREEFLSLMAELPRAIEATDKETLSLIERHHLMGRGLGYIDMHLLAATRLTEDTQLWTRDRRLAAIAKDLGIGYSE